MNMHFQFGSQSQIDPWIRGNKRQVDGMPRHSTVARYVGKISPLGIEGVLDPGAPFERIFELIICGFVYCHGENKYRTD